MNLALYEQLLTPLPSAPIPPPPPGTTEIYPEDQEHEEDDMPVDSSLSVDNIVAQVAGEARDLVDISSDEDEGVNGFFYKDSHQQHSKQLIFVRDLSLLFPRLSDAYYHIWKPDFYLFTTWLL